MRRDLENETTSMEVLHLQGIEDRREIVRVKLDINDSTNDGFYRADGTLCFSCIGAG